EPWCDRDARSRAIGLVEKGPVDDGIRRVYGSDPGLRRVVPPIPVPGDVKRIEDDRVGTAGGLDVDPLIVELGFPPTDDPAVGRVDADRHRVAEIAGARHANPRRV